MPVEGLGKEVEILNSRGEYVLVALTIYSDPS